MSSVVEICNRALSNIRASSINSLTESSIQAQQANLHYATARDFLLRDTNWQFAKKTVPLALLTSEPLHWTYAYAYPSDCLKMRMVTGDWAFKNQTADGLAARARFQEEFVEPELSVPFEIENIDGVKVIATDQPEAYAVYTRKITDPAFFDAQFETALSWYLSSLLAIPLVGGDMGRKMRDDAIAMYQQTLSAAIASDQNERKRTKRRSPSMIEVRR